ncbi:MAG: tRNA (guanine(46)-N(7))-methyltransferase [Cytophagales bacterium]|jgi:tRNA (guanine-N7-)-methyltransferase|nr:tRNA (guanosine(46)-N7)-methyltransferase TrmB [Bacteroidota bacterium]MBS1980335.1 tRNA (guanosine(46)-N7)-methyltransferase TrmB [Bacteroidota bacterium]WHZ08864.1 MAG: tRNA (guanine(46)-N(7))-methyltransferase [Cytophagales bacterium]
MKSKLKRFEINAGRENVIEPGKEIYFQVKGKWKELYFKNTNALTVELACGRGEYSVGLARKFPNQNFVGVDIKGDRLWKGSTWAFEEGLKNVGFLRTQILTIESFFDESEVDEIWLTFPDPRPRKRDIKRRLTSPRFLDLFKNILKPEGWFRFKTDNTGLFDYTLEELNQRRDIRELKFTHDLYQSSLQAECFDIKTRYEEMFSAEGEKIKYLRFKFDKNQIQK